MDVKANPSPIDRDHNPSSIDYLVVSNNVSINENELSNINKQTRNSIRTGNQPSQLTMTITPNEYEDESSDWSKQSLGHFFNPLESFLDAQLRRERSSKRRCREVVKKRELEQQRMFVETKLREFDEKINLDLLMKRRPKMNNDCSSSSVGLPKIRVLNFQQPHCNRCLFFQRCFEENGITDLNCIMGRHAKRKPRRLRLPNISSSNPNLGQTGISQTTTGSLSYLNQLKRSTIKF